MYYILFLDFHATSTSTSTSTNSKCALLHQFRLIINIAGYWSMLNKSIFEFKVYCKRCMKTVGVTIMALCTIFCCKKNKIKKMKYIEIFHRVMHDCTCQLCKLTHSLSPHFQGMVWTTLIACGDGGCSCNFHTWFVKASKQQQQHLYKLFMKIIWYINHLFQGLML